MKVILNDQNKWTCHRCESINTINDFGMQVVNSGSILISSCKNCGSNQKFMK